MKYLRISSDIHLDFYIDSFRSTRKHNPNVTITCDMDMLWFPDPLPDDNETTYIVAGDLWIDGRFATRFWPGTNDSWISKMAARFKYVVLVLGNHDYWKANVLYEADKVKAAIKAQGLTNVFLLERDCVVLDQVKFVGGTLWTDYNRNDPIVMATIPSLMNDFHHIKYGKDYRKLKPWMLYEIHQNTKRFIFENAKRDNPDQKVVVVTHMAPSQQSIDAAYYTCRDERLMNHGYYSDMDKRIMAEGQEIDFWFHGHTHHSVRYQIEHPTVILNAKGYLGDENPDFDPVLQIPV